MKRIMFVVCVIAFMAVQVAKSAVSVNWGAGGTYGLYNSSGTAYSGTGNLLIQLVIDVDGDTDFAQFESTQMLGIGSETGLGGVMATATDDVVGAWETAYWLEGPGIFAFSSDGVTPFAGETSVLDDTYASSQFYFRWFNAGTQGGATEAGFIWDTTWSTPAPLGTPPDVNLDYATVTGSGNGGGTELGSSGWQTVAPVPEPGTMALFALGVATLAAARRRKVAKA